MSTAILLPDREMSQTTFSVQPTLFSQAEHVACVGT